MQFQKGLGKWMSDRIGSGYWDELGHALALTPEVRWSNWSLEHLGPTPWSCCGQQCANQESDLVQGYLFSWQVKLHSPPQVKNVLPHSWVTVHLLP